MSLPRRRHPILGAVLLILTCALGLGSRRFGRFLPDLIATYAGDTLWALAAFLGIGLLLPRASTVFVAVLALAFSLAIEVSQLYHAPWIDTVRRTTPGGLVLGFDFAPSDLVCYAVGVGLGVLTERCVYGSGLGKFASSTTISHSGSDDGLGENR